MGRVIPLPIYKHHVVTSRINIISIVAGVKTANIMFPCLWVDLRAKGNRMALDKNVCFVKNV